MAVFSAIASAIGTIASTVGAAASSLGIGGALGGVAAAAGAAGTYLSYRGQRQVAQGNQRAEALRARQMNLEAMRERRATVRQSIIARAQALNAGTAQGAQDSSSLAGGLANVSSQAGTNFQSIGMSESIGQGMFSANRQISSGQQTASLGTALQGFGSMVSQNRDQIYRVTGLGGPRTA